ncbi:hypothetical protein M2D07_004625 [Pseudomonas sp. BGr12]|uniref:hypothetical protein n=1 Tax=Pseudomonas sp. BGr12 TaxID=2936269 RepID=UPI002559C03A|nr:hypothetical protein [Pseudomonas sp. BJa5]MDL2426297.1 hypothetical protein [Pseudomonas sp. BJa5]
MKSRAVIGGVAAAFAALFLFSFVLIDYSTEESRQALAKWAELRGVHSEIFIFYRWLNAVTVIGWTIAAIAAFSGRRELFKDFALLTLGYFSWDVFSYVPMAKLAGEGVAWEQWIFLAIAVTYTCVSIKLFPKEGKQAAPTAG